ncbi:hypothetical protein CR513_25015, partial [Mucuna pruriens]
MDDLKKMNEVCWRDLIEIPPIVWAKSHFGTYTLCDLQVNNMYEAYNKTKLGHKDKPIISLCKDIRLYMTNIFVRSRGTMLKYNLGICPMIQQILEKAKKVANNNDKYMSICLLIACMFHNNAIPKDFVDLVYGLKSKGGRLMMNLAILTRFLDTHAYTIKCSKCGQLGHNIRTCKGKTIVDREIPQGWEQEAKKGIEGNYKKKTIKNK